MELGPGSEASQGDSEAQVLSCDRAGRGGSRASAQRVRVQECFLQGGGPWKLFVKNPLSVSTLQELFPGKRLSCLPSRLDSDQADLLSKAYVYPVPLFGIITVEGTFHGAFYDSGPIIGIRI